jgi:hypothetical protein
MSEEGRKWERVRVINRRTALVEEAERSHYHLKFEWLDGRQMFCTERFFEVGCGDFMYRGGSKPSWSASATGADEQWKKLLRDFASGAAKLERGEFDFLSEPIEVDYS